jgi:hypothetical protein
MNFSQTLDALPASLSWAIKEYALPPDLRPIIASLRDGSACAVSDGSFKDKFGTAAFTILDAHECSILGLNVIPGHPNDQDPLFRRRQTPEVVENPRTLQYHENFQLFSTHSQLNSLVP